MQMLQMPVSIPPSNSHSFSIEKNVLAATALRATDSPSERATRAACRSEWEFVHRVRRHALQQVSHGDRSAGQYSETVETADNGWVTARTCLGGLVRTVKFRLDTDARIDVTQQSPDGHYEAWHVDGATLTVTSGDNFRSLRSVTYIVAENGAVLALRTEEAAPGEFIAPDRCQASRLPSRSSR